LSLHWHTALHGARYVEFATQRGCQTNVSIKLLCKVKLQTGAQQQPLGHVGLWTDFLKCSGLEKLMHSWQLAVSSLKEAVVVDTFTLTCPSGYWT